MAFLAGSVHGYFRLLCRPPASGSVCSEAIGKGFLPGSAVAAMIATRFESLESETVSAFVISAVISLAILPVLISLLV